jgi:hypothetical protein
MAAYIGIMRPGACLLLFTGAALAACGKSPQERREDVSACSANQSGAAEIAQCLIEQGGWSQAAADSAGLARSRELADETAALGTLRARADSQYATEVRACDQVLVDVRECLTTRYGWEARRAATVDDSVWNSRADAHARQIRACLGPHGAGTGSCLQLHYKWLPRRALAVDDSLRRLNIH